MTGSLGLPPAAPETLEPGPVVTLLPRAAHLACELDGARLRLHLRVQEGVAQVRVSGEAAPQLAGATAELRVALASAGLQLGQLDLGSDTSQDPDAPPDPDVPEPQRPRSAAASSTLQQPVSPTDPAGRVHLQA